MQGLCHPGPRRVEAVPRVLVHVWHQGGSHSDKPGVEIWGCCREIWSCREIWNASSVNRGAAVQEILTSIREKAPQGRRSSNTSMVSSIQ